MKTIGIYHTKGGVGKSAVTVFLADFLSSLYDKRVLVVDLDAQNNASGGIVGSDALERGFKNHQSLPRLLDAATHGEPTPETARSYLVKRPDPPHRGKTKYLASVSVLAGSRKDWGFVGRLAGGHPSRSAGNNTGFGNFLSQALVALQEDDVSNATDCQAKPRRRS